MPMNMKRMGVDLYSLSGHKIHGPKGVGALALAGNARVQCIAFGGGQENGLRSGTENVPGIAGLGQAVRSYAKLGDTAPHMLACKQRLAQRVLETIPGAHVNGDLAHGAAHILNITFPTKGEVLLHALEEKGIYVSTGSACSAHKKGKNRILNAMGVVGDRQEGAIRFSLSMFNTIEEMDIAAEEIAAQLAFLRRFKRR